MLCKIALGFIVLYTTSIYETKQDDVLTVGGRVVGGYKVTNESEIPYQVSLQRKNGNHYCGGIIIDNKHILTAAHCCFEKNYKLMKAKTITVVGGTLNLRNKNAITKKVQYIFVHHDYDHKSITNDIAVFRLKEQFDEWTPVLKPIPLATQLPSFMSDCKVSGWGTLAFGAENAPIDLHAAKIYVMSDEICKMAYQRSIKRGMFCAGALQGKIDSCQGDSGGPLEYKGTLIGVVSWGYKCAMPGSPGVYTNVSYYLDWIAEQQTRNSSTVYTISTMLLIFAVWINFIRI